MINTVLTYVSYFRALAQNHYKILHNPAHETFDATVKGQSHFAVFDNDEVVTGLRSRISNGVVLFLEVFTFRGYDNQAGDYRGIYNARFIIAEKVAQGDNAGMINAYNNCEQIVWELINRIIYDSNNAGSACGKPFKNLTLDQFSVEPVTNLWDGRTGWVVDFTFQQSRNTEMDTALATDEDIWVNYATP